MKRATKNQMMNRCNQGNHNWFRRKMIRMGLRDADFITTERTWVYEGRGPSRCKNWAMYPPQF